MDLKQKSWKRSKQIPWYEDGLAADRAKHPVRNVLIILLTIVVLYGLIGLECEGSRGTCRGRRGGAAAIPSGFIFLVFAASLWRTPVEEIRRQLNAGQSLKIMRLTVSLGVALVSGGIWMLADSYDAGTSTIALAGLAICVSSSILAVTTSRWGSPRALIPPPLREAGD